MILLIDDSENERGIIRKMLESGGHEVREAGGGDEGLLVFRSQTPAMVLCDLMMPMKDGFDTIAEMQALRPDAKIVAMSGVWYGAADHAAMAKQLGLVAVIEKPFNRDELLDLVEETLNPKPKAPARAKKAKKKATAKPRRAAAAKSRAAAQSKKRLKPKRAAKKAKKAPKKKR